ncbi:MAG: CPBP family intramembrane metalloprotease [Desulfobacterales bacterium]|nr:CPBP family intramembrane metalloprotease [Desulfobacterales bacterium]
MMTHAGPATPLVLRILRFPLIRIPLLGGLLFLGMGVSNGFRATYADTPLTAFALIVLMVILALTVYAGFVRLIERRPVSELSFPGMGRELGAGLLVGFGLFTACILILMLLGVYRVDDINPWTYLMPMLPMAISSGVLEELLYRGVIFRVLEEYVGSWIALAVASLFFGLRHMGNPDATLLGALFITVEAGVLLAAAFMVTRRLWLSIGFHMSWNYAQAAIFSGAVSGVPMPPGLVANTVAGPDLLTGGAFGVEASVVAFLLCTATGIALLAMAVRRGTIISPIWSRWA